MSDALAHVAVKQRNSVVKQLLASMIEQRVITRDEESVPTLLKQLASFSTSLTPPSPWRLGTFSLDFISRP